jgi:tetratricopeptide (TPR) repeat protein
MDNEKKQGESRLQRCLRRVEEHPESATARFNLGLAYTQQGRVGQAEQAYRKAVDLDPDLVEAWVNLGGALLLKWDFQGALEANREALARRDDLLLAHYNMGQAHLYLGDAEGLVSCCQRVIGLDEKHAAGHYYLAVGLLACDKVQEAREALARAMALGHRPTAEFLRGLEKAEQQLQTDNSNLVTNIGAEAPEDSKEN